MQRWQCILKLVHNPNALGEDMRGIATVLVLAWSSVAAAAMPGSTTSSECRAAIAAAERSANIPSGLLEAIGQVESGRANPIDGTVHPWPWTINAGGAGYFFATKTEAVAAAASWQGQGIVSIDVGCLQVNLAYHPTAFVSLDDAFDPVANAFYAAGFLRLLFAQTGSWLAAVAAYHSQTHQIGAIYQSKVLAIWSPSEQTWPLSDSLLPESNPANWSGGGVRDTDRGSAALDAKFSPWRPLAPSVPSSSIESVIGAVATCATLTETPPPPHAAPAAIASPWKAAGGICPASPFANPATLRQVLAGSAGQSIGR
jgi:Transglycosylase SLT domain